MHICITCSNFELNPKHPDPQYGVCKRLKPPLSLVTGLPLIDTPVFCSTARIDPSNCGPEGKFHTDKTLEAYTPEVPNV